jgi:hypothetical protein
MRTRICSAAETADLIRTGKPLLLAGDEAVLRTLPSGNWIAGSIPYFMGDQGGTFDRKGIGITELPGDARLEGIREYDADSLARVFEDGSEHGFSVIILPAASEVHQAFAMNAQDYPGFATRPLIGWIAGVALDELGTASPKVFDGKGARILADRAVVMHLSLPAGRGVEVGIVNLFQAGPGPVLRFPEGGFSVTEAEVDGRKVRLADFLKDIQADTRFPLVADKYGSYINTSFKAVDHESGLVEFFAPVFPDTDYHLAAPVGDYVTAFGDRLPADASQGLVFSCNCILNYLYGELDGKRTGDFEGPITFGEIAYQLLNQTLVYLRIEELPPR